ncbi:DegT/DnrJ/EryC1/StrS family aminotransferase [Thiohalomonas denitrificans]|uniref:DegT/DnrJ/EryC1/StrS family aminotransferase n=1 Tax=Thiohalomonas denitrificans TaxID=415747 RepID=UPI0026F2401C|nr:DegT/DnrJ/EryC1/StrS family aminotransferase [Thiohalomonas denitrificans]
MDNSQEEPMQFIDLESQQKSIRPRLEARIRRVLDHGRYIMGPEVAELEARLAEYAGVKHCVAVSSGTDSLLIAMMALGIGPGDEVITTPFTFIATGEVIALLGATPVFVDIDSRTYNIDPEKIETRITSKTRAIMPVSLYGQCADFDTINAIAARYGLPVIEDGAQSFGATYKGRKSCGLSTVGSTSFFPSKPLGGYGDSGALFTDEDELAKAMREIRVHGQDRRYHHPMIGINGRMDTIQAAILLEKLEIFPQEVVNRARIGAEYGRQLAAVRGVTAPYLEPHNSSVYAQYTIQVEDRDGIAEQLKLAGVPTAVHYPLALYRQPAFSRLGLDPAAFPETEYAASRVLSLPMHPNLADDEQNAVVQALYAAVSASAA